MVQIAFSDFFGRSTISAISSDGRNKAMFDSQSCRRGTDVGARKRRWNALKLLLLGYISPVGPFYMPFVSHDHDLEYFRNLWQLIALAALFRGWATSGWYVSSGSMTICTWYMTLPICVESQISKLTIEADRNISAS